MKTLPPCDHDECPPTRCTRTASDKAAACKELLGELWTADEIADARQCLSCVFEGVDCSLPIERMRAIEKRGLVTDLDAKPGRGRYANRYEYMWTDKLEELVKASRASSPNDALCRPAGNGRGAQNKS